MKKQNNNWRTTRCTFVNAENFCAARVGNPINSGPAEKRFNTLVKMSAQLKIIRKQQ